jgi:hypothetical protein
MRAPLPGPDLDQLVAERVMGWRREQGVEGIRMWRGPADERARQARAVYGVPRYSTDISAAWLVAEKVRLAVVPQLEGSELRWYATDIHRVVFGDAVTMIEEAEGGMLADSAPYAICLAALIASGLVVE